MVDLVQQQLRLGHVEVVEQHRRQDGRGAAIIRRPQHGAQRRPSDPVPAAFVAQHIAPSTRARGFARRIPPIRNRSGARDDHHARLPGSPGLERNQRVVDDQHPRIEADPLHDAADDRGIVRAIDAGDAEADRGRAAGRPPSASSIT